ncbi:MAG TPA: hypothetical protein DEA27_03500 [Candidatus Moranbacteria bacterium]|nr:hypothetical protein [Candidatus Moranbacteria bacterium]
MRGFKSRNKKKVVVKLAELETKFKDGDVISLENLIKAKIISKKDLQSGVKILSTGSITKKLTIEKNILLSESAKEAIEKAGGTVEEKEKKAESKKEKKVSKK